MNEKEEAMDPKSIDAAEVNRFLRDERLRIVGSTELDVARRQAFDEAAVYVVWASEQIATESAAPALYEVAKAYEAWEADIIENADWRAATPKMTQAQFDRLMEIQAMRNAALNFLSAAKAQQEKP